LKAWAMAGLSILSVMIRRPFDIAMTEGKMRQLNFTHGG